MATTKHSTGHAERGKFLLYCVVFALIGWFLPLAAMIVRVVLYCTYGELYYLTFLEALLCELGFTPVWAVIVTTFIGLPTFVAVAIDNFMRGWNMQRRAESATSSPTGWTFLPFVRHAVEILAVLSIAMCTFSAPFVREAIHILVYGSTPSQIVPDGVLVQRYLVVLSLVWCMYLVHFWRTRQHAALTGSDKTDIACHTALGLCMACVVAPCIMFYLPLASVLLPDITLLVSITWSLLLVMPAVIVLVLIGWLVAAIVWTIVGVPKRTEGLRIRGIHDLKDILLSYVTLSGNNRIANRFVFYAGCIMAMALLSIPTLQEAAPLVAKADATLYLKACFVGASYVVAASLLLGLLCMFFMLRGPESVYGSHILRLNFRTQLIVLLMAMFTKYVYIAQMVFFPITPGPSSLTNPSLLMAIDLGMAVPFYAMVLSSFTRYSEESDFIGNVVTRALSSGTYAYLLVGSGKVAEFFVIDVVSRTLFQEDLLEGIDKGYPVLVSRKTGISLQALPRSPTRPDTWIYIVKGMAVIDSAQTIRTMGTHPHLGTYGVLEIALDSPRHMVLLVPAIVEDVSRNPIARRFMRYAKIVVYTPFNRTAMLSMLQHARSLRDRPIDFNRTWPVLVTVVDSSNTVQLVMRENTITAAGSPRLDTVPVFPNRWLASFTGAFALIGWALPNARRITGSGATEAPARHGESGADYPALLDADIVSVGEPSRRLFYALETMVWGLVSTMNGGNKSAFKKEAEKELASISAYMVRPDRWEAFVYRPRHDALVTGLVPLHFRDSLGTSEDEAPLVKWLDVFIGQPHQGVLHNVVHNMQVVSIDGSEVDPFMVTKWLMRVLQFRTSQQTGGGPSSGGSADHDFPHVEHTIRLVIETEDANQARTCIETLARTMRSCGHIHLIPTIVPRPQLVASMLSAIARYGEHPSRHDEPVTPRQDEHDVRLPHCRIHCHAGRQIAKNPDENAMGFHWILHPDYLLVTRGLVRGRVTYGCSSPNIIPLVLMLRHLIYDRQGDEMTGSESGSHPPTSEYPRKWSVAHLAVCMNDAPGSFIRLLETLAGTVGMDISDRPSGTPTKNLLTFTIVPCNQWEPRAIVQAVWDYVDTKDTGDGEGTEDTGDGEGTEDTGDGEGTEDTGDGEGTEDTGDGEGTESEAGLPWIKTAYIVTDEGGKSVWSHIASRFVKIASRFGSELGLKVTESNGGVYIKIAPIAQYTPQGSRVSKRLDTNMDTRLCPAAAYRTMDNMGLQARFGTNNLLCFAASYDLLLKQLGKPGGRLIEMEGMEGSADNTQFVLEVLVASVSGPCYRDCFADRTGGGNSSGSGSTTATTKPCTWVSMVLRLSNPESTQSGRRPT